MSVGIIKNFVIAFTSSWLSLSLFINFFVIRLIFSEIDQFFLAGKIGMMLFTKFNLIETILSTFILSLISLINLKQKCSKKILFLSLSLFSFALTYTFYLTPKLIELTELWQKADIMGVVGIRGIKDIQQEHQFFHRIYIILDTVKLITLFIFLTLNFIYVEQSKSSHEQN